LLGNDPEGVAVYLKTGRFGPYVQLGPDPVEKGEKPKRSSIPRGWSVAELDLEQALKLLSLPREIGKHPEDGEPIEANLGRYGPYVKHLKTYANVPDVNELFEIGLNRAVTLIAEKRAGKGGGRGRQAIAPLREVGKHPDGEPINLYNGRYGPYLKHGTINANIPRGADPASITLEQAIELVDARAAAAPSTKVRGKKKAAKAPAKEKAEAKTTGDKKSTTKKAAAKGTAEKPAAKKAPAKGKRAKATADEA
jgi:DNA topoisomerase-1